MIEETIFLSELLSVLAEHNLSNNFYKREVCYDEGFEEIFYFIRVPILWSVEHKNKVFKEVHNHMYEFSQNNNLMQFLKDSCIIFV